MTIEVCDLCHKRVFETSKTEVIIKDYKGMSFDFGTALPAKRQFKGVICDRCLGLLRDSAKENKE